MDVGSAVSRAQRNVGRILYPARRRFRKEDRVMSEIRAAAHHLQVAAREGQHLARDAREQREEHRAEQLREVRAERAEAQAKSREVGAERQKDAVENQQRTPDEQRQEGRGEAIDTLA
jgi:hypothetical protein